MQHYEWMQMLVLLARSLIVIYIGIGLLRSKVEELEKWPSAELVDGVVMSIDRENVDKDIYYNPSLLFASY